MTVFEALADETRRRLLTRLTAGPRSAGDLASTEAVSRPAVSRHLRVLREAGLLHVSRQGRQRVYALRPAALAPVRELVDRLAATAEPLTPPVPGERLAALDLEVRRTVRDHRAPVSGDHTRESTG